MSTQALALLNDPLAKIRQSLQLDPRLRSPETRRGYESDLTRFEDWRLGRPTTKLLVEEYAAHLQRVGRSPNSINRALAAVRWWARRLVDIAHDEAHMPRAQREKVIAQAARVAEVHDVDGTRALKGRHVPPGELDALMRACGNDSTAAGTRDAALIALGWITGARRSELAGLALADFTPTLEGDGDMRIVGKGDKLRTAFVFNGAALALGDWLKLRGATPGPLFYRINKGGKLAEAGLSDEALAQMLEKRSAEAGIAHITWHDFRRTFAGNLLDAGHDLATVQKLMGHSSPTTTSNYDRRPEETRRRAVRSLSVPYRKRSTLETPAPRSTPGPIPSTTPSKAAAPVPLARESILAYIVDRTSDRAARAALRSSDLARYDDIAGRVIRTPRLRAKFVELELIKIAEAIADPGKRAAALAQLEQLARKA